MRYLLKEYREKRRDDGKQSKRIEIYQNQERLHDRILSASPPMQRDGRLERMRALLKKIPATPTVLRSWPNRRMKKAPSCQCMREPRLSAAQAGFIRGRGASLGRIAKNAPAAFQKQGVHLD